VERTVKRFEQIDSIKNRAKPDRPATSPDKVLDVLLSFVKDSHNSIRNVAQQHDISLASVHKTFKKVNSIHTRFTLFENYLTIILIVA